VVVPVTVIPEVPGSVIMSSVTALDSLSPAVPLPSVVVESVVVVVVVSAVVAVAVVVAVSLPAPESPHALAAVSRVRRAMASVFRNDRRELWARRICMSPVVRLARGPR
jgi:hypothetical protein